MNDKFATAKTRKFAFEQCKNK